MNDPNLFLVIDKYLKAQKFKKKGQNWNKKGENGLIWIINFQKSSWGTKEKFKMTVNAAVYLTGTLNFMGGKEPEIVGDASGFFRQRPRFFSNTKEWWEFDVNKDNSGAVHEIEVLIREKLIPFFIGHNGYEQLVSLLPIITWESNKNYNHELIKVAIGYFILKNFREAKRLSHLISPEYPILHKLAQRIINEIKNLE